jgi:hypothetical protein
VTFVIPARNLRKEICEDILIAYFKFYTYDEAMPVPLPLSQDKHTSR